MTSSAHRALVRSVLAFGALAMVLLVSGGCQKSDVGATDSALRPLTKAEWLQDFDALTNQMRALYGPLEFKERLFGFSFDTHRAEMRLKLEAATTEAQSLSVFYEFLRRFDDGHVGIRFPTNSDGVRSYNLPLVISPYSASFLVTDAGADVRTLGVSVGDELLSIDDVGIEDLLKTILKYRWFGNAVSERHLVQLALERPVYIPELKPTSAVARLKFKTASGAIKNVDLLWRRNNTETLRFKNILAKQAKHEFYSDGLDEILNPGDFGSLSQMGADTPFFLTPEARTRFGVAPAIPSDDLLKQLGTEHMPPQARVFAGLFRHAGKIVLLVRQPTYAPDDDEWIEPRMNYFRAILSQFQPLADVLVVDQTHNPGGWIDYAHRFFGLFIQERTPGMVQYMNTDRKWINRFYNAANSPDLITEIRNRFLLGAQSIEADYDAGLGLTQKPWPLMASEYVKPDEAITWKKPVLVLADELAGSCGDIFPMLMKRNGVAKIFGQRTMGLGGNVEEVIVLPNSQATFRLTRGMFVTYKPDGHYTDTDIVENYGITPDIPYLLAPSDARGKFLGYMKTFADAAVALVP